MRLFDLVVATKLSGGSGGGGGSSELSTAEVTINVTEGTQVTVDLLVAVDPDMSDIYLPGNVDETNTYEAILYRGSTSFYIASAEEVTTYSGDVTIDSQYYPDTESWSTFCEITGPCSITATGWPVE